MEQRKTPPLSKRLSAVARYVRQGSTAADVGTDHAYLPINLVLSGKAEKVIASDVVDGPLASAAENVASWPAVKDKIILVKADGLDGIEKYQPDDILICGMGGELIAEIIARSDYVKNSGINIVLQPMTKAEILRDYLYSAGFKVTGESIVYEDGKLYQIIAARYDGISRHIGLCEAWLGELNIAEKGDNFSRLVDKTISGFEKKIQGLKIAGRDCTEYESLVSKLNTYKEQYYDG